MENEYTFQISVNLPPAAAPKNFTINHPDETFGFDLEGNYVSIINNGQFMELSTRYALQETVNLIGEAIERH